MIRALVFLVLAGCGSDLVGHWRLTARQPWFSPSQDKQVDVATEYDFSISSKPKMVWHFGGGCDVPLSGSGLLQSPGGGPFQCVLSSVDGLPFVESIDIGAGDVLTVSRVEFSHQGDDSLFVAWSLRYGAMKPCLELIAPFGDGCDFTSDPNAPATRVR